MFVHVCVRVHACKYVWRPEVGASFYHSLPVPFDAGYPPESGLEFFSATLEANKPSDRPFSTYFGAGVIGIAGISGLIHGCWDPNTSPYDRGASALNF